MKYKCTCLSYFVRIKVGIGRRELRERNQALHVVIQNTDSVRSRVGQTGVRPENEHRPNNEYKIEVKNTIVKQFVINYTDKTLVTRSDKVARLIEDVQTNIEEGEEVKEGGDGDMNV